jgi:hypothetical protein
MSPCNPNEDFHSRNPLVTDEGEPRDLRRRVVVLLLLPGLGIVLFLASWLSWDAARAIAALVVMTAVLWLYADRPWATFRRHSG